MKNKMPVGMTRMAKHEAATPQVLEEASLPALRTQTSSATPSLPKNS